MFADVLERPQAEGLATDHRPAILIIDDDEALADVLCHRLQRHGYETITAETGVEGLAKARCRFPALILLDLRLPDMDGLSVCRQLADASETCTIPVIVLSGVGRPDVLRQCRAAGGHYFLRKPYDPSVLLTLVRQAIEETASWQRFEP